MSQGQPETILRLRLRPDGQLEYEDWRGRVVSCHPDELGKRAMEILADPSLPQVEVVNPGATHVAEVYARLLLPPDMRHMAGPGVVALQDLLKMVQGLRRRAPAQAHAHHEPPPEPEPEPPEPRRSVHRRGRRVA